MKNRRLVTLSLAVLMIFAFIVLTLLLKIFDVEKCGPNDSSVGFASFNSYIHNLTGVNLDLYLVTDWLGLVPIFIALFFAVLGLIQWIYRKSIALVDRNIVALGSFYLIVILLYLFFDKIAVNYRPVLIDGLLEPSYPSSTTFLVLCVMPTAIIQCRFYLSNVMLKRIIVCLSTGYILFMVFGRIISGVHWITDIIGGILLAFGLVFIYCFVVQKD